ncbi:MAG TPA: ArsI/CadI family heavy metal resistance metalloenzyme [Candidatus Baltobacteraceae bacterium]|jgi:catechol 2,3-dioxygenase-like lactoylglutathione lyase family enzyme|nr:ArsI/CadI family heavy metal resistance metalloenzyme [Candidatus Baltobacteraceae bacterium]
MKTHLNLASSDLEKSVAFYRTLLNCQPAKHLADYALFISEDPGLELALDFDNAVQSTHGVHFGLAVDSIEAVENAIQRLHSGEVRTTIEREETCCYAKQTKVWASDPDGRRWEIYTVHEETNQRDDAQCCRS